MAKIIFPFISILLFVFAGIGQNVGIGTNVPHTSAQLDISSTSKGLLAPRMTTAQRTAISGPAKGLLVYDTDMNALYHHNGSAWAAVGGGGGFTLPYSGSMSSASALFNIANTGDGKAITASSISSFTAAIEGNGNGTGGYGVVGNSASVSGYGIYGLNATGTAVYGFSSGGGVALRGNSPTGYALLTNGNLRLTGGNTNPAEGAVLTSIDANGNAIWKAKKIAFAVLQAANAFIPDNVERKIEFFNESHDYGNNFVAYAGTTTDASSKFTAPVNGLYHFDIRVAGAISNALDDIDVRMRLYKNGVIIGEKFARTYVNFDISNFEDKISLDLALVAGDKIWVTILQDNDGGKVADCTGHWNYFSGHLVFAD